MGSLAWPRSDPRSWEPVKSDIARCSWSARVGKPPVRTACPAGDGWAQEPSAGGLLWWRSRGHKGCSARASSRIAATDRSTVRVRLASSITKGTPRAHSSRAAVFIRRLTTPWLYRRHTTAVVDDLRRHPPGPDLDVDENGRHLPAPGNGGTAAATCARSQHLCPGPRTSRTRRLAGRHRAAVRSHRYSTRATPPELPEKRCSSSSTEPDSSANRSTPSRSSRWP